MWRAVVNQSQSIHSHQDASEAHLLPVYDRLHGSGRVCKFLTSFIFVSGRFEILILVFQEKHNEFYHTLVHETDPDILPRMDIKVEIDEESQDSGFFIAHPQDQEQVDSPLPPAPTTTQVFNPVDYSTPTGVIEKKTKRTIDWNSFGTRSSTKMITTRSGRKINFRSHEN